MKKLVAIALVLALATIANASASFSILEPAVNGGYLAGQVITIQLKATGASVGFDIGAVADGGMYGTVSNLVANAGLTSEVSPGYIENTMSPSAGVSGALLSFWSKATTGTAVAANGLLASFSYQIPAVAFGTQITIAPLAGGTMFLSSDTFTYEAGGSTAGDGGGVSPIAGATFTVVPEPMTLGLLGLGGLFLRRRLA